MVQKKQRCEGKNKNMCLHVVYKYLCRYRYILNVSKSLIAIISMLAGDTLLTGYARGKYVK